MRVVETTLASTQARTKEEEEESPSEFSQTAEAGLEEAAWGEMAWEERGEAAWEEMAWAEMGMEKVAMVGHIRTSHRCKSSGMDICGHTSHNEMD